MKRKIILSTAYKIDDTPLKAAIKLILFEYYVYYENNLRYTKLKI